MSWKKDRTWEEVMEEYLTSYPTINCEPSRTKSLPRSREELADLTSTEAVQTVADLEGALMEPVGPFTVVDADTNRPLHSRRFSNLDRAVNFGYQYLHKSDRDLDFKILDVNLNPVARRHYR